METIFPTAIRLDGWWPWLLLGLSMITVLPLLIVEQLKTKAAALKEARVALRARLRA
jgi:hypothetical protein